MEDFLGILVWIIFIIAAFARKFLKEEKKKDGNSDIGKKVEDFFKGLSGEDRDIDIQSAANEDTVYQPAYMEKDEIMTVKEYKEQQNNNESILARNRKEKVEKKAAYKTKKLSKQKPTGQKPCFAEKDIINGVIFKEILGEPRARRPYIPISKQR